MEECSTHIWNGKLKDECQCINCSKNHDWIEINRYSFPTTRRVSNPNQSASYDPDAIDVEVDELYIEYKCNMCGQAWTKVDF